MFPRILFLLIISLLGASASAADALTQTDIPCFTDAECHVESGSENITAVCVDNTCHFSVHVAPPSLKIVTRIGGKCSVHEECNINNAECSDFKICTCVNRTIASHNQRHCLPEAQKIGDTCTEDIQCNFPQTSCKAGTCVCDPGFGPLDNRTLCRELNGIGAACSNEDECEVEHTKCENGTCVCTTGFSSHKRECYEISASYLSKCDMDFQCQKVLGPDAICINRICHCQRKYVYSLMKNRCMQPELKTNNGAGFQIQVYLLVMSLMAQVA